MARNGDKWGTAIRPGRKRASFQALVSPLGEDEKETPTYSPSREVTGAKGQRRGQASQSESARDQRRGG